MKKWAKWGLIIIIAAALIAAGVYSALKPLSVETVTVSKALWESTFTETGDAVGRDDAELYSLYGGEIMEVHVKEGQPVKQGDIVIEFETASLKTVLKQMNDELTAVRGQRENAMGNAASADRQLDAQAAATKAQIEAVSSSVVSIEAALNSERIMLENLKKDLEDAKLLYDLGEISERELDKMEEAIAEQTRAAAATETALVSTNNQLSALNAQYASILAARGQGVAGLDKVYEAQISSIQSGIEELERKIVAASVKSPIDGMAGTPLVEKGAVAQIGMPLMTIFSSGVCDVECYVRVKDAFGIKVGDKVTVTLELRDGNRVFEGIVHEIGGRAADIVSSLGIAEKRVKLLINVEGDGWNEIKPGYGLDLRFTVLSIPGAIAIPKTALFQTEDGWAVWVIENGKAIARAVTRGDESTASAVITSGLNEGDIVVKDAALDDIKEGARISAPV